MPQPSLHHQPVLLTGASGFIGRRIQRQLLDSGYPVRALLRPGSPNNRHIDPRCETHDCGLTDEAALREAVTGIQAVVYCAGTVRGAALQDFLPANVNGVEAILKTMSACHAPRPFLLISSLAASRPELSHYAHSKQLGEQAVQRHSAGPWTVLRPPAVYGPGDTEMMPVLQMAKRGWIFRPGPEHQKLSLLYADDLASAVPAWLESWQRCNGKTFCIDDGHAGGYGWPEIAQAAGSKRAHIYGIPRTLLASVASINLALSRVINRAPMLTPGKVRELTQDDWLCDNSDFTQTTGWQPQTGLPCGIRLSLKHGTD